MRANRTRKSQPTQMWLIIMILNDLLSDLSPVEVTKYSSAVLKYKFEILESFHFNSEGNILHFLLDYNYLIHFAPLSKIFTHKKIYKYS